MSNDDARTYLQVSEIYRKIRKLYEDLDSSELSSKDDEYQKIVNAGVTECDSLASLVANLHLFSENETLEDISSANIKYLTVPAYSAFFYSRQSDRISACKEAVERYEEFNRICNLFQIPESPASDESVSSGTNLDNLPPQLRAQALAREQKLKWHRVASDLAKRLSDQQTYVEQSHVDDEVLRQYNIDLVRWWSIKAQNELPTLKMESDFLARSGDYEEKLDQLRKKHASAEPRKPYVITKDMVRRTVFGPSYPSQPTMSLEEFRAVQIANQSFPVECGNPPTRTPLGDGGVMRIDPSQQLHEEEEQDRAEEDEQEERDDPARLEKLRGRDEFRDENRRGAGNTYRRL